MLYSTSFIFYRPIQSIAPVRLQFNFCHVQPHNLLELPGVYIGQKSSIVYVFLYQLSGSDHENQCSATKAMLTGKYALVRCLSYRHPTRLLHVPEFEPKSLNGPSSTFLRRTDLYISNGCNSIALEQLPPTFSSHDCLQMYMLTSRQ